MKRYKIIGKIVLCFFYNDEPHDILFGPESNNIIESDGTTVWCISSKDEKWESITTPNVIDVGLKNQAIEEINL